MVELPRYHCGQKKEPGIKPRGKTEVKRPKTGGLCEESWKELPLK
jgi:hypothetical protein